MTLETNDLSSKATTSHLSNPPLYSNYSFHIFCESTKRLPLNQRHFKPAETSKRNCFCRSHSPYSYTPDYPSSSSSPSPFREKESSRHVEHARLISRGAHSNFTAVAGGGDDVGRRRGLFDRSITQTAGTDCTYSVPTTFVPSQTPPPTARQRRSRRKSFHLDILVCWGFFFFFFELTTLRSRRAGRRSKRHSEKGQTQKQLAAAGANNRRLNACQEKPVGGEADKRDFQVGYGRAAS